MTRILGIILIVIGGYLVAMGVSRKNSLVGQASTAATDVSNSVNGGTSEPPKHVFYIAGGAVLIVVGAVVTARGGRA